MRYFKNLATIMIAFMLTVWGAGPSLAANPDASKAKASDTGQVARAVVHAMSGTVSAVQPKAKTIEVKAPRGKKDNLVVGASVTDRTVIREGKRKKSLEDLKVGDHVWMEFERGSSGDIAKMIVIKPGKKHG
ncbi:MAG: hypothetical protein HY278_01050 [candidate division NC10 bacterium]|nr:hypothetical protein [candidate division NC10 bacterium]